VVLKEDLLAMKATARRADHQLISIGVQLRTWFVMPKDEEKIISPKRFYFKLPSDFAQLGEHEQDQYLDYFAKQIWQTVVSNNEIERSGEKDE
jgi:hypothetical protein